MAKLSQIIGKKVRNEIPFYYQDNEGTMIEDKITIYSPTKEQLLKIKEQYSNLKDITEEDFFYFLLNEVTSLEVDLNKEEFVEFMSYYSDVFEAVKTELEDIVYEIILGGVERLQKIFEMPEDRRIKMLAFNPELKKAYDDSLQLMGLSKNKSQKEVDKKMTIEEFEAEKKRQEKEEKRKALLKELEELESEE